MFGTTHFGRRLRFERLDHRLVLDGMGADVPDGPPTDGSVLEADPEWAPGTRMPDVIPDRAPARQMAEAIHGVMDAGDWEPGTRMPEALVEALSEDPDVEWAPGTRMPDAIDGWEPGTNMPKTVHATPVATADWAPGTQMPLAIPDRAPARQMAEAIHAVMDPRDWEPGTRMPEALAEAENAYWAPGTRMPDAIEGWAPGTKMPQE